MILLNKILTQLVRVVPYLNPIVVRAIQDYFYVGQDAIAVRMRDLAIRRPGLFKAQYKSLLCWEKKLPIIPYVLISSSVSSTFVTSL